jgi:hypothetical protein
MDFEKAYKPHKPFWAMSIPELVAYNNKCKRLDEYFFKGKSLKTPRSGGSIIKKKKKRKTRNRKNRKTRRRKNKGTRRRRKLTTIRTTNEHHSNQTQTKT